MAVHLVHQSVDKVHAVGRRFTTDHLPITHAEKGSGRGLSRQVVNGRIGARIRFEASCKGGSPRPEGPKKHDFSSRTKLQIGLQSVEDIASAHQFSGFSGLEWAD